MPSRMFIIIIIAGVLFCSGCVALVPLAPPELDHAAKQFQPFPGQGQLYIVWPSSARGSFLFQVIVDGHSLGGLAMNTYFLVPLAPGPHSVVVFSPENQGVAQFNVEPGRQYFVQVKMQFGIMNTRVGVEIMEVDAGRQAVQAARLATAM